MKKQNSFSNNLRIVCATLFILTFSLLSAQVDYSFGGNGDGSAKILFGATREVGYRTVVDQSNGKIYVNIVSDEDPDEGGNSRTFIYRLLPNGSIDATFGPVILDTPNASDEGYGLALQTDGKIIVAGKSQFSATVWRINPNGTLDNSFGQNGKSVLNNEFGIFRSVAIQNDGKIVAAGMGSVSVGSSSKFSYLVARFMPNGTKDPSFGTGGFTEHRVGSTSVMEDWGAGWGIALQPIDEKIVVCGYEESNVGTGQSGTILRFTTNGSLDNTFSMDGVWTTSGMSGQQYLYDVKVTQGNQKIVACGTTGNSSSNQALVVGLINNGNFDNSFAGSGLYIKDFASGFSDSYRGIEVQGDGKYVISGSAGINACVFRLTKNGQIDNSFDNDGIVMFSQSSFPEFLGAKIYNNCLFLVGNYTTDISFLDKEVFVSKICLGNIVDNDDIANPISGLEVFPNPGDGPIYLRCKSDMSGTADITILDISGRIIYRSSIELLPGEQLYLLTPGDIIPGLYVIHLILDGELSSLKYIRI